jgi:putative MFS transporter
MPKSKINQLTLLNMGWNVGISFFIFTALIIELLWVFNTPGWMILVWVGTLSAGFLTYYRSQLLESPHYLYNRGDFRLDGVLKKVFPKQIAEINKNIDYVPRVFLRVQDRVVLENNHENMLKNTISLTCEYFFANTPYYCLIFFMPDILPKCNDYVLYTVMFLQQLSGIPGVITASYLINGDFGAKYTRVLGFSISAVLMFSLSLPLNDYLIFVVSCGLFFFLTIGLSTLYTFSQEMYPTAIRGTANGWLCGISLITGCVGPVLVGQIKNMSGITPIYYILTASFSLAAVFSFGIVDQKPEKSEYIN